MASLSVTWPPADTFVRIERRTTNDLPPHVKGTAYWVNHETRPSGYYYAEPNQEPVPVEFINDVWYILHFVSTKRVYGTCVSYQVDPNDQNVSLGRWHKNGPANPNNQITPTVQIQTTNLTDYHAPSPERSESEPENQPAETWGPQNEPFDEVIVAPGPLDEALAAALDLIVSLQGSLPLDPPQQETMSVNVTTTTPAQNAPSNGGMRGVPPTIFDGTHSKADDFMGQFRQFKMVNRTHEAMKIPYDRVLTTLTYIRGPLINDWVDQQEKKLATRTDTTKRHHVLETDEVLWNEFETAFLNAWTDTSKKQNAYDQLMRLTMNGWDVDTYIATFDRLALAAEWDLDSEGTIAKFREGLSKGVHSKALDRDRIPRTIDEWKAAARTEVARAKEKYNVGLTGTQRQNPPKSGTYQNPQTTPRTNANNSGTTPMEVDNATGQTNFKKLTPEERAQLAKEGHCFRCRLQGHMARDCPKNANRNTNANACKTSTESKTPNTPAPTSTTPTVKLTRAQQIRALEEAMEDEERAAYLDARDMGSDFWSAGA